MVLNSILDQRPHFFSHRFQIVYKGILIEIRRFPMFVLSHIIAILFCCFNDNTIPIVPQNRPGLFQFGRRNRFVRRNFCLAGWVGWRENVLYGLPGVRRQLIQNLILPIRRQRCPQGIEEVYYLLLGQGFNQMVSNGEGGRHKEFTPILIRYR